jgi:hypothetical protein
MLVSDRCRANRDGQLAKEVRRDALLTAAGEAVP